MKIQNITNRSNLPEPILNAIACDPYTRGGADISVTGLLKPPRMAALEELYRGRTIEDAADKIWALIGQGIHVALERANVTAIAERRLSIEMEGWVVSGGVDLYEEKPGHLTDYKTTSVWRILSGDLTEWEHQLNLYSLILKSHGYKIKKLQVIAILRDWSKFAAMKDPRGYPQSQVLNLEIPLWEQKRAESFLRERVIFHQRARIKLPECSDKECWSRPDVFAVKKSGRKSAVKLYSTEEDALTHVASDNSFYIEHRPGQRIRCKFYCQVSEFCSQFQSSLANEAVAT